jgi:hypothetical protein
VPEPSYIQTLRAASPWLGRADRLVSIKLRPLRAEGGDARMAICVPRATADPRVTPIDESAEMLGFVDPEDVLAEQLPPDLLRAESTLYDVDGNSLLLVRHETGPELIFLAAATVSLVEHIKSFALFVLRRIQATERAVAEERLTLTGGYDRTAVRIEVRTMDGVRISITIDVSTDELAAVRSVEAAVSASTDR